LEKRGGGNPFQGQFENSLGECRRGEGRNGGTREGSLWDLEPMGFGSQPYSAKNRRKRGFYVGEKKGGGLRRFKESFAPHKKAIWGGGVVSASLGKHGMVAGGGERNRGGVQKKKDLTKREKNHSPKHTQNSRSGGIPRMVIFQRRGGKKRAGEEQIRYWFGGSNEGHFPVRVGGGRVGKKEKDIFKKKGRKDLSPWEGGTGRGEKEIILKKRGETREKVCSRKPNVPAKDAGGKILQPPY